MPYYKHKTAPTALLVSLLGLSLTACTSTPEPINPLAIPNSVLTCEAEPIPKGRELTDQQYALWIKDVIYAGRDCRDQLAQVRDLLDFSEEVVVADVLSKGTQTKE